MKGQIKYGKHGKVYEYGKQGWKIWYIHFCQKSLSQSPVFC